MMVMAHKMAKQMVGNYSARLSLALRQLWASLKKGVVKMLISQINLEVSAENITSVAKWNKTQKGYAGHARIEVDGIGRAVHITRSELETIIGYGFIPELVTLKYTGTY